MKKHLLLVTALWGMSLCSMAQSTPVADDDDEEIVASAADKKKGNHKKSKPEDRASGQSARFKQKFGLNDVQSKQVYDIFLARAKKADELKAKKQTDKEASKAEWKAANEESETKLKEVLTAEQYTAYNKWKEDKKAKQKAQHDGHGHGEGKGHEGHNHEGHNH